MLIRAARTFIASVETSLGTHPAVVVHCRLVTSLLGKSRRAVQLRPAKLSAACSNVRGRAAGSVQGAGAVPVAQALPRNQAGKLKSAVRGFGA